MIMINLILQIKTYAQCNIQARSQEFQRGVGHPVVDPRSCGWYIFAAKPRTPLGVSGACSPRKILKARSAFPVISENNFWEIRVKLHDTIKLHDTSFKMNDMSANSH